MNEKTGKFGWMSKDFGFIPNDHITPEQYAVVNREDWTITIYDRKEESFTGFQTYKNLWSLFRWKENQRSNEWRTG